MNKRTTGIIIAILVVVLALIAVVIILKPFSNNVGPDDLDVGGQLEIDEYYDVETGELITDGDKDNSSKTDSNDIVVAEPGASKPDGTTSVTSSDEDTSSSSTSSSSSDSSSSSNNVSSNSSESSSSNSSSDNSSSDESKISNTNSQAMEGMKPWR